MSALVAFFVVATAPGANETADPRFRVVLDPGHDPLEPGAMGTTGVPEWVFNDRLAERVAFHLRSVAPIESSISRAPAEALRLGERVRRIAAQQPDLVVSLHHDSVKPRFIDYRPSQSIGLPSCDRFSGYSIFAQTRGPHRRMSVRSARSIADRYRNIGLRHTTYHALKIRGENRKWIDVQRGIHAGDYLYLLRKLDAPVVLVESGFVVNPTEEQRLRDPTYVEQLAIAIAEAVVDISLKAWSAP